MEKESYRLIEGVHNGGIGVPQFVKLVDDKEFVKITLKYEGRLYVMRIEGVILYRRSEERFMMNSLIEMERSDVIGRSIMTVENSSLIAELSRESMYTISDLQLTHVRLIFLQDIIDLVTTTSLESIKWSYNAALDACL